MELKDPDIQMRLAAFDRVQKLSQIHERLTAKELNPGFIFERTRYPLVNPQRGIFKPRQMKYLLSIKTVYPRSGAKIWYDDQRKIHQQIFKGEESVDYAFKYFFWLCFMPSFLVAHDKLTSWSIG